MARRSIPSTGTCVECSKTHTADAAAALGDDSRYGAREPDLGQVLQKNTTSHGVETATRTIPTTSPSWTGGVGSGLRP